MSIKKNPEGGHIMEQINILVVDDEKEIADLVGSIWSVMDIKYLRQITRKRGWRFWIRRRSIWYS